MTATWLDHLRSLALSGAGENAPAEGGAPAPERPKRLHQEERYQITCRYLQTSVRDHPSGPSPNRLPPRLHFG